MRKKVGVTPTGALAAALCALCLRAAPLPEPTFHVGFDGGVAPDRAAGAREHPSLKTDGRQYVEGKLGRALLLGKCAPLVYQAAGNVPDEATVTFWVKPLDWQKIAKWRQLLTINPRGRSIMYLAHYPKRDPVLQFLWTPVYSPGHEATAEPLQLNQWNHVAVAWDGVRSRVYFNGRLVLSKTHPSGFRPKLPDCATLQIGGLVTTASSRSSYQVDPWGVADTALDELTVYPGALSAVRIAQLAGRTEQARTLQGPSAVPPVFQIPKIAPAPTLDGRLEAGEWDAAASLPTLIDGNDPGRSFDYPPQRIHLAYDDANLYVAMRSVFPIGAQVPMGGARNSLEEPDEQVWDDESFELWLLRPGEPRTYRFAGNVTGGYTEMLGTDNAWNGTWNLANSTGLNMYGNEYWQVELAVPWKTIGVDRADNAELRLNFCRTWRCLEQLGVTSVAGAPGYPEAEHFAVVRAAPGAPGYGVETAGSPSAGKATQTFTFRNPTAAPLEATFAVTLEAALAENDQVVKDASLKLAPGEQCQVAVDLAVADTMFQRLRYCLTSSAGQVLLDYSAPFELRADFLDVIPLLSQDAVVVRPAVSLYRSRLKSSGVNADKIVVRLLDPAGKTLAEHEAAEDKDLRLPLPQGGPAGEYRVQLYGLGPEGRTQPSERRFERPEPPVWLTQRDDVMDRVLPPFEPLRTTQTDDGAVTVRCWGRAYRFERSLLPVAIASSGAENLLAAPISLMLGHKPVGAASVKLTKRSPTRTELVAGVEDARAAVSSATWIEYDGVVFHQIELRAKQAAAGLSVRVPCRPEHAGYAHFASGGFGAGGGFSTEVDRALTTAFYPVVWLGDFERGLAWFCEGGSHIRRTQGKPVTVTPGKNATILEVKLWGRVEAGESVTVRFGFIATPVKPLHPRYPLNVFARDALWDRPPRVPCYASVLWRPYNFFQDIPFYDPSLKKTVTGALELRANLEGCATKVMPYMTPYTLTSEYPSAVRFRREWELVPVRHNDKYERPVAAGEKRQWTELWMSPASESYRRFYAWKFGEALRRTGMEAVYFDFGCAMPDSNAFHGGHGGFCLLGLRDLYRRIVNEFVKAGVEDYVIVAHNSQAVQIPALAFVTHFYSGEHLRTSSSTTLYEGRDYLDTLPLYYFGIEQSGLPWGVHGNMLVEFDEAEHLMKRIGVTEETVTEYLWNRTPSVVMPILLHGCLPDGYRLSLPYYKSVFATLHAFDAPSATFHPYWRNADRIQVDHPDVRVSAYARPEAPRLLLVVGNLNREAVETTIRLDLKAFHDWNTSSPAGMKRVGKKGELLQVVERVGARDARLLEVGPHHLKLWVQGHRMALVEATGHIRIR